MNNAVLIHLPHSSVNIPAKERSEIQLADTELQKELLILTDRYTDELFTLEGAVVHKNQYSRLVFDPERFRNDKDEIMARFGMGAIYTHAADGRIMRSLTGEKREEMLKQCYDPYHLDLEAKTEEILNHHGRCMLIDGHSFPERPLPFELDQTANRPDICIGTCDFHTPEALIAGMEDIIRSGGLTVNRNTPFAGTMVPMKYYLKDKRVISVMIEVNRRLYMNEATGEKLPQFDSVAGFIKRLMEKMVHIFHDKGTR